MLGASSSDDMRDEKRQLTGKRERDPDERNHDEKSKKRTRTITKTPYPYQMSSDTLCVTLGYLSSSELREYLIDGDLLTGTNRVDFLVILITSELDGRKLLFSQLIDAVIERGDLDDAMYLADRILTSPLLLGYTEENSMLQMSMARLMLRIPKEIDERVDAYTVHLRHESPDLVDYILQDRDCVIRCLTAQYMCNQITQDHRETHMKNDRALWHTCYRSIYGITVYYMTLAKHMSEEVRRDPRIAIASFYARPANLKDLEVLHDNPKVMLDAVKLNAGTIQYASPRLKENREIAEATAAKDGMCIRFLPAFHDDFKAMLLAVEETPAALQWASDVLKNNLDLVLAAVKKSTHSIQHADPRFLNNKESALSIIKVHPAAVAHVSLILRNNPVVMLAAIKGNHELRRYVGGDLFCDLDFAIAVSAIIDNAL
jgi:hypothetical protein